MFIVLYDPVYLLICLCVAGRSERVERCLADGQRGDSTIRGLTAGLVLVALLGAGAVGLTVWMCRRQHPLLCRGQLVTIVYITALARELASCLLSLHLVL